MAFVSKLHGVLPVKKSAGSEFAADSDMAGREMNMFSKVPYFMRHN